MSRYTEPHWPSSALVTVDMQVDFADGGAAEIAGTSSVAPGVARLAQAWRGAGLPVVHLVRLYVPGSSDVDLVRREHVEAGGRIVAPGSAGSAIIDGIAGDPSGAPTGLDADRLLAGEPQVLGEAEVVPVKPRWGGFHRTGLEAWLRDRAVDTVVVAGCNLPTCPRATLFEASERDFRTVLVADAVSGCTPERLADLRAIGVTVFSVAEVVGRLEEARPDVEAGSGAQRNASSVNFCGVR